MTRTLRNVFDIFSSWVGEVAVFLLSKTWFMNNLYHHILKLTIDWGFKKHFPKLTWKWLRQMAQAQLGMLLSVKLSLACCKRVHAKETISLHLVVMTIVINAIEYTNTKVSSFNKIVFRINNFISLNLQCKPINWFNELTSISSYNIGLPRQPSASALRLTKML